jgi:hypothetical protein
VVLLLVFGYSETGWCSLAAWRFFPRAQGPILHKTSHQK